MRTCKHRKRACGTHWSQRHKIIFSRDIPGMLNNEITLSNALQFYQLCGSTVSNFNYDKNPHKDLKQFLKLYQKCTSNFKILLFLSTFYDKFVAPTVKSLLWVILIVIVTGLKPIQFLAFHFEFQNIFFVLFILNYTYSICSTLNLDKGNSG